MKHSHSEETRPKSFIFCIHSKRKCYYIIKNSIKRKLEGEDRAYQIGKEKGTNGRTMVLEA